MHLNRKHLCFGHDHTPTNQVNLLHIRDTFLKEICATFGNIVRRILGGSTPHVNEFIFSLLSPGVGHLAIAFEVEVGPAEECAAAEARRGAVVEVKVFGDGPAHRAHVGTLWLCRRWYMRLRRTPFLRCPRDGTRWPWLVHNLFLFVLAPHWRHICFDVAMGKGPEA